MLRTIPVGCVDAPLGPVDTVASVDVTTPLVDEPPVTDTVTVVSAAGPSK